MRFDDLLWYGRPGWGVLLAPLGLLWAQVARLRRAAYRFGVLPSRRFPVPVIVVGNISVGGTGKTPLTVWLAGFLQSKGFHPAIVCSGYGGQARTWPQQVRADSDPAMVGDEAVLIARHTGCPVGAGPDRVAVVEALMKHADSDVLICDDGLQHLALARDIEIVVVDGGRRHGNCLCLPAGPLREPVSRLKSADFVVVNGVPRSGELAMDLRPGELRQVTDSAKRCSPHALRGQPVHAVCGIGNPHRAARESGNRNAAARRTARACPGASR